LIYNAHHPERLAQIQTNSYIMQLEALI